MNTLKAASIKDLHDQLIAYLKAGKFVEGIVDFYAEDATAQENSKPLVRGREHMAQLEARFQKKLTAYHGIDIHATAFNDEGHSTGIVFYECTMRWEQNDRTGIVAVDQVVVERWRNGKITAIRFFGNYEPGELPA